MLSIYRAGEIDLFENLDIVHIRLLVDPFRPDAGLSAPRRPYLSRGPAVLMWRFFSPWGGSLSSKHAVQTLCALRGSDGVSVLARVCGMQQLPRPPTVGLNRCILQPRSDFGSMGDDCQDNCLLSPRVICGPNA